ncbi:hypothetical protein [Absidia glauca]|uniref:Uncharacterized protein n=1 Tax=Absidia glauca TaxID=4829 RepID=A0A163KEE2_ABSGL|nr:hypothetical protein [Absidia glauca]
MSSELEQLMDQILETTQQLAKQHFIKRNQNVTNHLSRLPTDHTLQRDATPAEAKLFTTSWTDAEFQQYDNLFRELKEQNPLHRSFDRLLSMAHRLNSISPSSKIQGKINGMKRQYEECKENLAYMESVAKDNERALQGYEPTDLNDQAKTVAEQELHLETIKVVAMEERIQKKLYEIEQAKQRIDEKQLSLMDLTSQHERQITKRPRLEKNQKQKTQIERIEQLKRTIQAKQALLNTVSESAPPHEPPKSNQTTTTTTSPRQLQLKIIPDHHGNKDIIPAVESIIQALKDIIRQQFENGHAGVKDQQYVKAEVLREALDKMNHFRDRIMARLEKDIQEARVISPSEDERQELLMAMALIHQHDNDMPLEELKHKVSASCSGLGLDPALGAEAIYNWVGKGVFRIDRTTRQLDSIVKSNWEE